MTERFIYHIARGADWTAAGEYRVSTLGVSLDEQGYIHASRASQVAGVAARFYAGVPDLVVLVIESARVRAEIRYEDVPGSAVTFPHVYGPINADAVVRVIPLDEFLARPFSEPALPRRGRTAGVDGTSTPLDGVNVPSTPETRHTRDAAHQRRGTPESRRPT